MHPVRWQPLHTLRRFSGLPMVLTSMLVIGACDRPAETPPGVAAPAAPAEPHRNPNQADLVFLNGYVYTADAEQSVAQALAVRDDRIIFVGSNADARAFVGEETQVIGLDGKMLLPGLHDTHIHLFGMAPAEECDLESEPLTLAQVSARVADCLAAFPPVNGWLAVNQWNFADGNAPDAQFPTMRAALDAAAGKTPVFLRGNDGHHAAVNSSALARARGSDGKVVGLSSRTIDRHFRRFRPYIGVNAAGEPDGHLSEGARLLVDPPDLWGFGTMKPERVPLIGTLLARSGITSVQDAALRPEALTLFEDLAANGEMTFRLTAALYPDLRPFTDSRTGRVNISGVLATLAATRDRFRHHPLIDATAAKIFIDGVIEGNPRADPPTLPNAAVLQPYRQPLFSRNATTGELELAGYVATDSPGCADVRSHPDKYAAAPAVATFRVDNGFHPDQCTISRGTLEHTEAFIRNYMHALYEAGFVIHAHAIGDRAVRVVLANFAELHEQFGDDGLPHAIAHAQLVHPDDQVRIGQLGLFVAFTYAWMSPAYGYDISVIPFVSRVRGIEKLYDPRHYGIRNAYPARSIQRAGGILVAGSDAPVDARDPRPFVNMAIAVSRANEDGNVLNRDETISIHDVIAAYTRNGARALRQDTLTGQLRSGYKADIIVTNQNIVELAEAGQIGQVAATQVLTTMFDGRLIFQAF